MERPNPKVMCTKEEGKTRQEMKGECDVNKLMSKYHKTGRLPELIKKDPKYGDFSTVPEYQDALNIQIRAQQSFNALGPDVRKQFDNDPAKMLLFVADPKNKDELIKLGLAIKPEIKPEPAPVKVKVIPDEPAKP